MFWSARFVACSPGLRGAVAAALSLVAMGCAENSNSVQRMVGCYDIDVGDWTLPEASGLDTARLALPYRLELFAPTDPLDTLTGHIGRVSVAPGVMPAEGPSSWKPVGDTAVVLVGYLSGVALELRTDGDTLRGRARYYDDLPHALIAASATATRVECGALVPPEHRARYVLPRGLPLEGHDSIRIDEPLSLPARLRVTHPDGYLAVRAPAAGMYAGAGDIRVWLDERTGAVRRVALSYPVEEPFAERLRRFEQVLGEPTTLDVETGTAYWNGGLVAIALGREGTADLDRLYNVASLETTRW